MSITLDCIEKLSHWSILRNQTNSIFVPMYECIRMLKTNHKQDFKIPTKSNCRQNMFRLENTSDINHSPEQVKIKSTIISDIFEARVQQQTCRTKQSYIEGTQQNTTFIKSMKCS
jgi:hypothetical protein